MVGFSGFTLQVHVTSACDAACAHCYQRGALARHMARSDFDLLMKQYLQLVEELGEAPGARARALVTITGGEPLLHPEFHELAQSVWACGFGLAVLTNGHFIDEDTADLLKHAEFVQVSLDGDRRTHDLTRGDGDFARVLRSVRLLHKAGANAMVSFTAHAGNLHALERAADAARRAGAATFWTDRYLPIGEEPTFAPLDPGQTREYLDALGRAAKRNKMVARHRALQFLCGGTPYRCHAGHDLLAVTETCEVLPCRRLPLPCGDFRETPLLEIFTANETIRALRAFDRPEECAACPHAASCGGGLRCLSAATGDWRSPDPACPILHA